MRTHSRCPKCNGTKLYVCTNHQPDDDSQNFRHEMAVATVLVSKYTTGAERGNEWRSEVGTFETWICAACGYTEWYAQDPERAMQILAKLPEAGVRIVDSSPKTPFR